MPKNNVAKTALAPKYAFLLIALFILLVLFLLPSRQKVVRLGNSKIFVDIANNVTDQQKGLSGRQRLDKNAGLLFDFNDPSTSHCIWMKDMAFSIDVIWLNQQKKIIDFVKNVEPASYPTTYCPKDPAQFMLEVNEGTIDVNQWKIGQQATF